MRAEVRRRRHWKVYDVKESPISFARRKQNICCSECEYLKLYEGKILIHALLLGVETVKEFSWTSQMESTLEPQKDFSFHDEGLPGTVSESLARLIIAKAKGEEEVWMNSARKIIMELKTRIPDLLRDVIH